MSEVSFSEPEQILSSGTEPELEPPAVHPAPPGADWVSSSSSEDDEAKYIRLLETVSHPAELEPRALAALQALALIIEEEDRAREEAAGPVVRDNIPDLERPVFVRASNTDPKIMTPTSMLKATATNLTPPKLPRPLSQPLGEPEPHQQLENILPDLGQVIEGNTLYK